MNVFTPYLHSSLTLGANFFTSINNLISQAQGVLNTLIIFLGVVIFLIWFWLINVALLFGIELDAEIERTTELKAGVPRAAKEIQLDARAEPKDKQTT